MFVPKRGTRFRPDRLKASSLAITLLCLGIYAFAAYVLWQPVIAGWRMGFGVGEVMKAWYPVDQFSYLNIADNVSNGDPAYVEPFMLNGSSIYPSGYYWLLGIFSQVTGLNIFAAWNVVGLVMTFGLMGAAGYWGYRMTGKRLAWLLGPIPVLIGTLEWWTSGDWKHEYPGVQAVQWQPFAILFNPGAEQATLFAALVVLIIVLRGISRDGTLSWRHMAVAGAIMGTMLNAHSYVPLLTLATVTAAFVVAQATTDGTRKTNLFALASGLAGVGVSALHIPDMPLGRFIVVLAGLLLPLLIIKRWRLRTFRAIICFYALSIVFFLPLLIRLGIQAIDKDSYLHLRQHIYDGKDFSIPMADVFMQAAPVLLLGVAAIYFLWKRRAQDEWALRWAAFIGTVVVITLLMEWNAHWGFAQEAYRFFPYQLVVLSAVAAPWLVSRVSNKFEVIVRVIVVVSLVATLPTTKLLFDHTRNSRFVFSPQEEAVYKEIGRQAPEEGVVMVDLCIPPKTFKIFSDAHVADIVGGLGLPNNHESVAQALRELSHGYIPSDKTLSEATVTSFLTMNYCNGPTSEQLTQRFGKPIGTFPLENASECGMPDDTTYTLYRVTPGSNTQTTQFSETPVTLPYKSVGPLTNVCAIVSP